MEIKINLDKTTGDILTVYQDEQRGIIDEIGEVHISRISNVEPDNAGNWWIHFDSVKVGPFKYRNDAIKYEIHLIELGLQHHSWPTHKPNGRKKT